MEPIQEIQPSENNISATPNSIALASKPHKSTGLIIAAIIFAILAIAGIAAAIYFFIDSNNKATDLAKLKAELDRIKQETSAEIIEENETIVIEPTGSADQVFSKYSETLLASIKRFRPGQHFKGGSLGEYFAYIDSNADLYINKNGEQYNKVASDVLDFSLSPLGNGGANVLYFVDKDGNVSETADLYGIDLTNIASNIRKIGQLKNIISINFGSSPLADDNNQPLEGGGGISPRFIDINGNVLLLSGNKI